MIYLLLCVFVVDDDEDDFIFICDMLCDVSEGGYIFEWCVMLEQGFNELCCGVYDVYLVDYLFGLVSGLDLIEVVNCEGLICVFIVLIGCGNQLVDMVVMEVGVSDYLVKGLIDVECFVCSICYVVDYICFVEVLCESEICYCLLFDEGLVLLMLFDVDSLEIFIVNEVVQVEYVDIVLQLVGV